MITREPKGDRSQMYRISKSKSFLFSNGFNLSKYAFLLAFLLMFRSVFAMPANPSPFVVRQPNGKTVWIHIRGDEWFHWYEDTDGYTVVYDNGRYAYGRLDKDNRLIATPLTVGVDNPKAAGLKKKTLPPVKVRRSLRPSFLSGSSELSTAPVAVPPSGTVKNLVILCMFSNHTPGVHTRVPGDYDILFNQIGGDPTLAPTGSVKDLYIENSYNTMTLQSTITVWVTLPNTEAYYANGYNGTGSYPQNAQRMVEDALNLVDPLVDFSQFDDDLDGYIDAIDIIHSGYAAETGGGGGNWIWSHRWSLWALPGGEWTSAEGVKVYDYHTEPALWGTSGTSIVRFGVIAHETGHFFGLPDLYDTDGGGEGIGSWCMMANSWGFDGTQLHPPNFSAWCKTKLGWVTPTVIAVPGLYTIAQAETNPQVYRIDYGYPSDEYLLIENRQPVGIESAMPQGGLCIFHIDDLANFNTEGYPGQPGWPENGNHYRVALLQADGNYNLEHGVNRGDRYDVYHSAGVSQIGPGPGNHPNTDAYQSGNIIVTNNTLHSISAAGASMSFEYNNIIVSQPPVAQECSVQTQTNTPVPITLVATDDGLPNPPGALIYIITSLPASGVLTDPGAGDITDVNYTLVGYGNQVIYTPNTGHCGSDDFTFKANDGGVPPNGGNSNQANVSIIIVTELLTEGFESPFVSGAPPSWTKSFQTGTVDWTRNVGDNRTSDTAHGGTYNAMLYYPNSANHETYLITPQINFAPGTTEATLEFWHKQAFWSPDQDTLKVCYKTSAEGSWTELASYTTNVSDWTERTISLPNPSSTYYIGFLGNAKYGYGVCIDDVKVTACGGNENCNSITIGTGNLPWDYPMHTYYHDSRTQVIYLASEIGSQGTISSLALDVATVPGQIMNYWTIRMKHTPLSSYSTASLDATGWTVVYQGNEPIGTTGWRTFNFSTPFEYNGTDNLLVDFSHNNTSWTTSGYCRYSIPGGTRSAYAYSDSAFGDPLNWSGTNPPSTPTVIGNTVVPNIKLTICPQPYCPASSVCVQHINAVQIGSINNTATGCSTDGYGDYTSLSTSLQKGIEYPIIVENGAPTEFDRCGIWVDWNQDLDFDDTDEEISVEGNPGFGPYTATITPPVSAIEGDTRMRVRIVYGLSISPCGLIPFGETEDYTITVTAQPTVNISGYVKTSLGVRIKGVCVFASTGQSTATDALGKYELTLPSPFSGTITPAQTDWTFSPTSRTYSVQTSDVADQDFSGTYLVSYGGGSGTFSSPYLIYNAAQLNAIGAKAGDWNKYFKLMADIDLSGYDGIDCRPSFNRIGYYINNGVDFVPFTGNFDGNGHTISNFIFDSNAGIDGVGIFGYVRYNPVQIKNVKLTSVDVNSTSSIGTGGLVGFMFDGTVSNCSVEGGTISGDSAVGGLVGLAWEGTISNCSAEVGVSGDLWAGGLLGSTGTGGIVSDCHASCIVTGGTECGGLIGSLGATAGTATRCSSTGSVTVTGRSAGGLVGENDGTIELCFSTANVIAPSADEIGGLVGRNLRNIANSYAWGSVSGSYPTGGLAGLNWKTPSTTGSIVNCYSTGASNGGGLIGDNVNGVITGSFWDTETSGRITSDGGTGKTTAQMQTQSTFTDAGWDFINETVNGTADIWYLTPMHYPRFVWAGLPPQVVSWEIGAPNGLGEIWCEVEDGYIEPRTCGIQKLRVCFDTDMNTVPIDISQAIFIDGANGGTQTVSGQIIWESSTCMVIELSSVLPDEDAYIITLTDAIKSAAGIATEWQSICLTALKGDANGDRSVTAGDLLAIRAHNSQPIDCSTARYDINCDGAITAGDLSAARLFIPNFVPNWDCPWTE